LGSSRPSKKRENGTTAYSEDQKKKETASQARMQESPVGLKRSQGKEGRSKVQEIGVQETHIAPLKLRNKRGGRTAD